MDVNDLLNTIVSQAVRIHRLEEENAQLQRALRDAVNPVHTPPAGEGPDEGPGSPEGGAGD